jgi:hypothetical protein
MAGAEEKKDSADVELPGRWWTDGTGFVCYGDPSKNLALDLTDAQSVVNQHYDDLKRAYDAGRVSAVADLYTCSPPKGQAGHESAFQVVADRLAGEETPRPRAFKPFSSLSSEGTNLNAEDYRDVRKDFLSDEVAAWVLAGIKPPASASPKKASTRAEFYTEAGVDSPAAVRYDITGRPYVCLGAARPTEKQRADAERRAHEDFLAAAARARQHQLDETEATKCAQRGSPAQAKRCPCVQDMDPYALVLPPDWQLVANLASSRGAVVGAHDPEVIKAANQALLAYIRSAERSVTPAVTPVPASPGPIGVDRHEGDV